MSFRGGGNWGTLRIPREDLGNHHPPLRILLFVKLQLGHFQSFSPPKNWTLCNPRFSSIQAPVGGAASGPTPKLRCQAEPKNTKKPEVFKWFDRKGVPGGVLVVHKLSNVQNPVTLLFFFDGHRKNKIPVKKINLKNHGLDPPKTLKV